MTELASSRMAAIADPAPTHVDAAPGRAEAVLRHRDMLCFSHDWTGDPLSKTHLMRLLARDNRILWVNSIGYRAPSLGSKQDVSRIFKKLAAVSARLTEVEKNIFVLNPLAIPFFGPVGRRINSLLLRFQVRRAMRKLSFKRSINWVFNPAAGVIARKLGEEQLIYYCVDEYTAFTGVASQRLGELESDLLRKSDVVFVSADKLYESKAKFNANTFLIRHGVDHSHFRKALDPRTIIPADIADLPKPVIGFFGLIADWIDMELLGKVAEHFSGGSLVMLGKITADVGVLKQIPNVHFLGRKKYDELPAYAKAFDVALNPFRINTLTLNANPLKVREYLAAGLPVVSTRLPEVEVIEGCRIGDTPEGFIHEIEHALENPAPSRERSEGVRSESWEDRLEAIRSHMANL